MTDKKQDEIPQIVKDDFQELLERFDCYCACIGKENGNSFYAVEFRGEPPLLGFPRVLELDPSGELVRVYEGFEGLEVSSHFAKD